ncbi:4-hydroxythreonine-4-phosphate dehydrogenase PdxA [Barnesiella propionica]|uniref:4-hydroxythreonine-4-phosphate dehydrogenase PdxA n=1 Tax=Barnesiella propionica TaxID=2981781 RepID=UPI0011C7B9B2|nr:4-hydroxythreonine-4-phosphate dehydrogenase PdxA [Barnesiella propionica]MCU6769267.1 4-hydroxythreonine-4-phosphate dehydrogenase PdxA [Barnesiella propionica]
MDQEYKIKVGITQGDINGIGYEVILKTLSDPRIVELCTPVVYGSAKVAAYHRKALDMAPVNFNIVNSADQIDEGKLNIINCIDEEVKVEIGRSTPQAGEAAFAALERATDDMESGLIDVLLTAPINKHNIQSDKFDFPGHTEYLERKLGNGARALMILLNDTLRVALVTGHLPLSEVSAHVTKEAIIQKLQVFHKSLIQDFGIVKPRIAVLSLNPHAGDSGLLGTDEEEKIIPAIQECNDKGLLCFGPYPADGFFGTEHYKSFDGVLAMYHDQGLAPFKAIAMDDGVNFTAGLPYVRTSPDHGTAYDIAGQGKASEESFRHALYLAIDVYRNRKNYIEMHASPLRKQYYDKSGDNEVLDLTADTDKD